MKKVDAYKLTKQELKQKLQELTGDTNLAVTLCDKRPFYYAFSKENLLSGSEIDELLAKFYNVKEGFHIETTYGLFFVVMKHS